MALFNLGSEVMLFFSCYIHNIYVEINEQVLHW